MNLNHFSSKKIHPYGLLPLLLCLFMSIQSFAQSTTIKGVVTDNTGLPIPGANVIEKGTTNSSSSDFDGKYAIKVSSPNAVLIITYIGFEKKEVKVNGSTINISLKSEEQTLKEVIVIGYGTSKKSDLTGSVSSISGADLKKQPIANVAETLTGRIAGVQITSSEGSPDADIKIRIRGGGSLTQDSSPLVIVDGFPVNSINDVSPSDIDNISILKDASSTAIYGSRGANGVVIITTKKGKNGKLTVNYNTFYGVKSLAKKIEVLSPEDFAKFQYEYALVSKKDLNSYEKYFGQWQDYDQYSGMKANDWQEQIYGQLGEVTNHDIGIRGGSEKINFNFNYARFDEKAIMVGSNFNRNNITLGLNNKVNDKIDLSFTLRYSDTEINGGGVNEQREVSAADARLRHSVGYSPIPLPGLTTDDTDEAISSYLVNPFVSVADNDRTQNRTNYNMLGNFSWKIIPDLQFKSDFGLDNYTYSDSRFYGRSTFYVNNIPAAENQGLPAIIISERKDSRFRNVNTLNYDFKKIIGENHKLKVLLGEEMIDSRSNQITNTIHGFPKSFSFTDSNNLSSQGKPLSVNNFYSPDDKLLSFFGRVTYDYKNRYLFTATYRADGSSKFLGDNRWGYFPAAAVAWKISEENFLKDVNWLNALKLRVSYGEAGNNNIPTGQTIPNFESGNLTWINNVPNYWSPSKFLANPDLKWETTITQNIGLDYELFNGKLSGTVEMYKNITKDLLTRFPVPGSGYDFQYRNMGETQNTGFETSLNIIALEKQNYGLNFSFNIGINKNRINSLGLMDNFLETTNWASTAIGTDFIVNTGQPIGQMYGYQNDGRYEVSDFDFNGSSYTLKPGVVNNSGIIGTVVPGSMKLKDIDGDGFVTAKDRTIIGDANPKHTGGMVINANAYGFDLSAAFNWSYENDIYNANKIEFTTANPNGQYRNLSSEMADGKRWTNLNAAGQLVTDPTELAALNANTTLWSPMMSRFVLSDWAIEDGSFLRLNTLSLGYSLPQDVISKLGISKFRVYTTATNVFVLTNYSGLDPEVSTRRNTPLTPGVDYSPFPRSRQVVFGLNLNF